VVTLFRHDPVNLCQEALAAVTKILTVPPGLDETMNDEQKGRSMVF
jgi:hypothetical protein